MENIHKHCDSCYIPTKCTSMNSSSCKQIKCPNLCKQIFHECKLDEHLEHTCSLAIVNCINYSNGCKLKVQRYRLNQHLKQCPANIVECKSYRSRQIINNDKLKSYFKWPDPIDSTQIYVTNNNNHHETTKNDENCCCISKIILNEDKNCFFKFSNENKYKFNCYYKYLVYNLNDDFQLKLIKKEANMVKSKIFDDIKIDDCVMFNDGVGCLACRTRLKQLEMDRYQKLTANLNFMDLLKSTYDYEQFIRDRTYKDKAFLYLYNFYYKDNNPSGGSGDSSSVLSDNYQLIDDEQELDNALSKSNANILKSIRLNEVFSAIKLINDSDDSSKLYEQNKQHEQFSIYRHKQTTFSKTCMQLIRRDDFSKHYSFLHDFLQPMCDNIDKYCCMHAFGCDYSQRVYDMYSNGVNLDKICYNNDADCMMIGCGDNGDAFMGKNDHVDYLRGLPIELVEYILSKLDSLSLYNLSLTSKYMRKMCESVLYKHGIVYPKWEKVTFKVRDGTDGDNDKYIEMATWKCKFIWTFSKYIEPPNKIKIKLNDHDYYKHIKNCPYRITNKYGTNSSRVKVMHLLNA